ncbi:MAG: hypothetical protein B1H13_03055 [Desulfobacteraceae bacterium 4484_190.3]|nr:MAG: hypothetical protein B1H13_03055 [Desulfobacteraceae bacterium 4484_190.3]
MPFSPNSALYSKNYPRNINYIPAVIFFVCLDFEKNCYSRATSQDPVILAKFSRKDAKHANNSKRKS